MSSVLTFFSSTDCASLPCKDLVRMGVKGLQEFGLFSKS